MVIKLMVQVLLSMTGCIYNWVEKSKGIIVLDNQTKQGGGRTNTVGPGTVNDQRKKIVSTRTTRKNQQRP